MLTRTLCLVLIAACSIQAEAQGLRVSTHVYDLAGSQSAGTTNGREHVVSSSLSLFHNGRVYDYVDAADEVVIFDPQGKKFTVLNLARDLSTNVSFEEIRHLLDARNPVVEEYIRDLGRQQNPGTERIASALRFQLKPAFTSDFDVATGNLSLRSASWNYQVTTQSWPDAEQVQTYLTWCDWTARLNHILHPGSLFPEPRLELNSELKQLQNRIPVRVELNLNPNERLHLRADHQFTQDLDENDRRRIARWEQSVTNPRMRQLSFRSYQQTILVSDRR